MDWAREARGEREHRWASRSSTLAVVARRAAELAGAAALVPVGWLLWQVAGGASLGGELVAHGDLYGYLLISTALVFGALGAVAGRREARLLEVNDQLDILALTDPTTGLKNVRYFRARLAETLAQAARERQPVAVAVIDLDRFKAVNDRFGHPAGDRVLGATACAIAGVCRRGETAARVGGEEFAVILPGSDGRAALAAAERIRRAVEALSFSLDGASDPLKITASIGVASTVEVGPEDAERLFAAADRALLDAKNKGRNCAVASPATPPFLRVVSI
jgi:diguanylate cyclase (GGDEF)-like protein